MQENSLIKKNILQFIDYKRISKYKFYQETGITRGVLDQKNGISEENIARFLAYYKDVDANWLLTGRGEMLKKSVEHDGENPRQISVSEDMNNSTRELIAALKETITTQKQLIARLSEENEQLKSKNKEHSKSAISVQRELVAEKV